jgi:chromosome segregation ATPase
LDGLRSSLAQYNSNIQDANKKLDQLTATSGGSKNVIDGLKNQIKTLEDSVVQANNDITSAQANIASIDAALLKSSARYDVIKQEKNNRAATI